MITCYLNNGSHVATPMPTQCDSTGTNPNAAQNFWNFSEFNGFIKMLATWSAVGTYSNLIESSSIFSCTQWCQTLICLECVWKMGFSANTTVGWLSTNKKIRTMIRILASP